MPVNQDSGHHNILFITSGFPTVTVQRYTFLDNLICAMANRGEICTVIYPFSITHSIFRKEPLPLYKWFRECDKGKYFRVYCPKIITISNSRIPILRRFQSYFNNFMFEWAVKRTIRKEKLKFNLIYGHFISPSGFVAAKLGNRLRIMSCLAYGENSSYTVDEFGVQTTRKKLKYIKAVISVSSNNTRYLIDNNIVSEDTIKTIPNAVNRRIFYPRDKSRMRKKYDIPEDVFVVAFVGYFTHTKGSARLAAAIDKLEDVYSIFIGNGEYIPACQNILFVGNVTHKDIPEFLSAADVFVLPTIAEGCCNAIIEALSCGLPVISSNLPFNDDILNDECSIRINTMDIGAIADSIRLLRDNHELREKMERAALEKAKDLDINRRAGLILNWIEHRKQVMNKE